VTADIPGLDALRPHDQAAVGETMGRLLRAFGARDADALEGVYTDDADWVNAFGTVRTGRAEIVAYLRGLFADANFDAGKLVAPPESRLRRLGDTVVAVSTHLRITGQGLVGGSTIDMRDNHSLHILQRQPDGRWLVVSEIYMDARQDQTYARGSRP
jgi:uncharacterized protein (TIGR02246 family)